MTSGNNEQIANKLDQHVKEHLRASQTQKSVQELDAMIGLLLLNKPDVVESPVTTEATETVQAPITTVGTTSREATMTTIATTSRETLRTTEAAECASTSTRTVEPTTLQATPTKRAALTIQTLMEALVVTESLETTNGQTTVVAPATVDGPGPETTQSPTIAHLPTATVAPTIIQSPIGENAEAPTTSVASTSMQIPTTFVPTARSTPTTVQLPETTHSILNTSSIHYTVAPPRTTKQAPTPKHYAVRAATIQQQKIVKHYPRTIRYARVAAPPTTMQQLPTTRHYTTTIRYAVAGSRSPTAQQAPAAAVAPVALAQRKSLAHLLEAAINRLQQRRRAVPANETIQSTWAALAELQEPFESRQQDAESDHRAVVTSRLCDEYKCVVNLLKDFVNFAFEE